MAPVIYGIIEALAVIGASWTAAEAIGAVIFFVALNLLAANSQSGKNRGKAPGIGGGLQVNYYDSEAPLRIVFGFVRAGGMQTLPPITSGNNGEDLNQLLSLAGHEVDSFCDVLLGQDRILNQNIGALTGTGSDGVFYNTATGFSTLYDGWGSARRYAGTSTQAVDWILSNLVDATAFTSDFRGRGIAYAALSFRFNQNVWHSVPGVTLEMNGAKVYDPRLDSTNGGSGAQRYATPSTWAFAVSPPLCLAYYLITDLGGAYDPASEIDWPSFAAAATASDAHVLAPLPFATVVATAGNSLSGNVLTNTSGSAWSAGIYSSDGIAKGSVSARDDGASSCMVGLHSSATYVAGANPAHAWVISIGSGFFIQQNGVNITSVLRAPTANDIVRLDFDGQYVHYFLNGKKIYASAAAASTLYLNASVRDATNAMTLQVQSRYTCNGALLAATTPDEFVANVKKLMNSFLGRVIYANGRWYCYAGGWQTPTFSIAKTDWVGPTSIKFENGLASRFNRVHGWFLDRLDNWQRVECYARFNDTYKAADGYNRGSYIEHEFDDELCTDENEMQRKSEFLLRGSRNQILITGTLGPKWQDLSMWDTGTVVIDDLGWAAKTFRVAGVDILPNGSLGVSCQEEQSTDWTDLAASEYGARSAAPLPDTNVASPTAPQSFDVTPLINGTLLFTFTDPVIKPYGTRLQVVRGTNFSDASVGTVVWEGDQNSIALIVPTSTHYYWGRARVGSQYSGYTPNTFGTLSVPQPPADNTIAKEITPDPEIIFSERNFDYWAFRHTAVFSLSLAGGAIGGKIIATTNSANGEDPVLFSLPTSPLPRNITFGRPYNIYGRYRRTTAIRSMGFGYGHRLWLYGWNGVGTPTAINSTNTFGYAGATLQVNSPLSGSTIPINEWQDFSFVNTTGASEVILSNSYPYLVLGLGLQLAGAIGLGYTAAGEVFEFDVLGARFL